MERPLGEPIAALDAGASEAEPWRDANTISAGIRVPSAIGDYLILDVIRQSHGTATAVDDAAILDAQAEIGRLTGIFPAPEGAATFAAIPRLRQSGFLRGDERVVIVNTGMGLK